jgi:hypothetical protein
LPIHFRLQCIHVLTSYDEVRVSRFYRSLKNIAWSLEIFCEPSGHEPTDEEKEQFVTKRYKNGLKHREMTVSSPKSVAIVHNRRHFSAMDPSSTGRPANR